MPMKSIIVIWRHYETGALIIITIITGTSIYNRSESFCFWKKKYVIVT